MYCVYNATTLENANQGSALGWPLETKYGYFCDQRDRDLFLLSGGLVNLLAIVATYLIAVLYLGPKFMQNRKPLEIKTHIRSYNFTMILVNIYLMRRLLPLIDNGQSFFNCKAVEVNLAQPGEMATLAELFLYSRLADFLDTIWFVLRKKQSHISFLHVFHHSYVPLVSYLGSRWVPISPSAVALPFINAGVHVVMYTYYLLATYPALRQHLWWKRYLTGLQMAQFVSILFYNVIGFFMFGNYCGSYQIGALFGSLLSAAIFLALFYSFYQKAYVRSETKLEQGCTISKPEAIKQHQV